MRGITIGTPDRFEMEHVEICRVLAGIWRLTVLVKIELMQQVYSDFIFRVGERAHVSIVAGVDTVRVGLTEFHLVFLWMVEFFNSVVCARTAVPKWAFIVMLLG